MDMDWNAEIVGQLESHCAYAGTAKEALEQLDREHDAYIQGVRGLGTAGLSRGVKRR
jgi:hypothetical protein